MFDFGEFKNPSSKYRSKPFWSLNGKLEKEELKRQILEMKEMGFGGAFLHSRTQLETEYMSEEWLDLMEFCANVLKENGMETYLYDEDRWPSGTCGGTVTMTKEFQEKSLNYREIKNLRSYKKCENFIALFAVTFDKDNKYQTSFRKLDNFDDLKNNERVFEFFYLYAINDPFYNGNTYVDTLNLDATKKFIELTHEKYLSKFKDRFGKDIKGIFQDEANRGPFFSGFTRIEKDNKNFIPYTYKLFEEFNKRKGYKIEDNLPKIWFGESGNPFVKETYDLIEVLEELLLENFAKPYYDWCTKHNLMSTGHILHEDNLAAQTLMSGSCMRYYEFMHYPGIDNLGRESYFYTVPALVSSVSKQLGKEYSLDELYGLTGWEANLDDYKRIGDWQSALGITLRCPHLSWYTMKGEAKRDCPASLLHQSSWYKKFSLVEDYFSRLTYLLKESSDTVSVAIINPIESTWGLSNEYTYVAPFITSDPLYQKIEYEYSETYKSLVLNGIMADYIDEGILLNHGKVENDLFICGLKKYKTIILNGNYELRENTYLCIKEFIKNGGRVILVGDYPQYLDGVRFNFKEDLKGIIKIDFDMNVLVNLLKDDIVSTNSSSLIVNKRIIDGKLLVFILNRSDNKEYAEIKIKSDKSFIKLNLRTGEKEYLEYERLNDNLVINKEFGPNEELMILESDEKLERDIDIKFVSFDFPKEYDYKLMEDNMLQLSYPSAYFDNEKIVNAYCLDIDRAIREKYNLELRFEQMIQPWFKKKYLNYSDKLYTKVKLVYNFNSRISNIPLKIMFEKDDTLKIKLNGHIVEMDNKYNSNIDICYNIVNINKEYVVAGKNTLVLEYDFYESTNIEPIYLLGDFGVYKDLNSEYIDKLAKKIKVGDLVSQGLMYYGGEIELKAPLQKGTYKFEIKKLDVSFMNINGKNVVFSPFNTIFESDEELKIDLILNRFNSFRFEMGMNKKMDPIPSGLLSKIDFYKKI